MQPDCGYHATCNYKEIEIKKFAHCVKNLKYSKTTVMKNPTVHSETNYLMAFFFQSPILHWYVATKHTHTPQTVESFFHLYYV